MNNIGSVRFGAWVLNTLEKQVSKDGKSASVTLEVRPESEKDLKYGNLAGCQPGTELIKQASNSWSSYLNQLSPVKLSFQTNDKGELTLQSQYTVVEHYTEREPVYRTVHHEAGRGMTDAWEAAYDSEEFTGHYENVGRQRNATKSSSVELKGLGLFRELYDLLDNVKVNADLLKGAALKPLKETPRLNAAFATLGAGNDLLKKLLLEKIDEQPDLKAALEEETPVLKETALQPVLTLLSAQGKKVAPAIQQQAAEVAAQYDQGVVEAQKFAEHAKADLAVLTQRITG